MAAMAGLQLESPAETVSTDPAKSEEGEPEHDKRDVNDLSEDELPHAPPTIAERRRAQVELFENWLASYAGRKAMKPSVNSDEGPGVDDEEISIQSFMTKNSSQIIKNPREYQLELFERAKKENTIAVLYPGCGKTLIAVLLIVWMIDQELEHRMNGEQPKVSFFLVASVTLAFQQFAVLEQNMDHKVAKVCGADGVDEWNKSQWDHLLSENMVIVATADVLKTCLARNYINMKQINLLIFDEAHHAKKNHAFAIIMKEFYIKESDLASRPRIFGMTASPVDAKSDIVRAANDLEAILHCKIATTNNMSLSDAVKKPIEQILMYNPLPQGNIETVFLKSIQNQFPNVTIFRHQYATARDIARHLGRWCADQYLMRVLSESKLLRYELQLERTFYDATPQSSNDNSNSALYTNQALIREVINFVAAEQSKYVSIGQNDFSSKVSSLRSYLNKTFEQPTEHRCIIFVEARKTAQLLAEAFKYIGTQYLLPGCLVGSSHPKFGEDKCTFLAQVITLKRFRNGEINCLFATSVAEEGLDVPDCNFVVRFDMYKTMIQYVQSRGRARKASSTFIHMLEKDNSMHRQLCHEVKLHEKAMQTFCQALPEDRRLQGNENCLEFPMARDKSLPIYIEKTTGARLTYENALDCLARFVSAIPNGTEEIMRPTYVISHQRTKFIAEVLLPGNSPLHSVIGQICPSKALAKRSAALTACIELRKKQYINEYFLPVYQKKLPAMRNALLAINMRKTNQYFMRSKPSIWSEMRGTLPDEVFFTIFDFPSGLARPHQPLALLTRKKLPDNIPDFTVYLNDGRATIVRSTALQRALKLDDRLDYFTRFTFRVFQDVFSKTYRYEPPQLSYWIAPVRTNSEDHNSTISISELPDNLIDWNLLHEVYNHDEYKWGPQTPPEFLLNRFVVDRWDGSRKFYSKAICPDLKPLDLVPEQFATHKWMANILDYSNSMFKSTREKFKDVWDLEQPVLLAEKCPLRRDMLAMPDRKKMEPETDAWICLQPLKISVLTPATATSCMVWPAIIHRVESYLIALEACVLAGVECEPAMALAAITKDSNSNEHEVQDCMKLHRGMGENYERLEFIGDTFLKAATSISTFIRNPDDKEFEFHVKRMLMLCNQNLFNVGVELKLYEYIRSRAFSRRAWYPEGLKLIEGKGAGKPEDASVPMHALSQKTIADVCEALIGASYLYSNRPGEKWHPSQWDNAVRTVTKLVNSPDHTMRQWRDYISAYELPHYQTGEVSASQRYLAEKVEQEYAYRFNYPRLLRSAFTHPSQPFIYEKVPNYQRLEFLGDALLDLASITYLFYRFPNKDPQWLTEHKMAMVSNKFLGAVCVNIGFHKHLRHSSAVLPNRITEYVTELLEAKRLAGDARDYWTTVSDPPKCLPDIVESFVGAMFIDSNFDYNVVQDFFEKEIKWYFEDMSIYNYFAKNHPCTHLHHLLQRTYGCSDFRLMAKENPSVDATERKDVVAVVIIHDKIVSHSQGKSGRHARLRAAQMALKAVERFNPIDFRSQFRCGCHLTGRRLEADREASKEIFPTELNV